MAIHITVGSHENYNSLHECLTENDTARWPVPKGAAPGDTILFLIPARSGDIVARGTLRSETTASEHWTNKYDGLIGDITFRPNPIPIELLADRFPEWGYLTYARGYTTVPDEYVAPLEALLNETRRLDLEAGVGPDELDEGFFWEGSMRQVTVNAYERNPRARRLCIAAHGTTCCVCEFDFGAVYGPAAEGFIHVHHLCPLSEIAEEYQVDPVNDLRPVCPNCHAVIHRRTPPYSIEEVCAMLAAQRRANKK